MGPPPPLISALGIVSRDEYLVVDHYPTEGSFATVTERLTRPGGTTGNIASGLARLGARVRLFAKSGDDDWGRDVATALSDAGVDTSGLLSAPGRTDLSIMLVSAQTRERTIVWDRGVVLEHGDRIDIDRLFNASLTVVDTPDHDLRRFLSDLPAHTYPNARLLGTLTYLSDVVARDKLDVACRFDVVVGNEREYCQLTGELTAAEAFDAVVERMKGSNLRTAVMTRGDRGAVGASSSNRFEVEAIPANVVDTTGAGDAFVAGLAYAVALRWDLHSTLCLANAVASHAVRALGAQTALPTLSEGMQTAGLELDSTRATSD